MGQLFLGATQYISTKSQKGQVLLSATLYVSRTLQRRRFHRGTSEDVSAMFHVSQSSFKHISTISKRGWFMYQEVYLYNVLDRSISLSTS